MNSVVILRSYGHETEILVIEYFWPFRAFVAICGAAGRNQS